MPPGAGGVGAAAGVCRSQGVNSYPSWKINGKVYTGLQSLTALQGLSGFDPAVKFPEFVPPGAKPKPKPPPGGFQPPAVTERSSPEQIALATHLKESGAKFFGAYWCRYCNKQRQMFGAEALRQLPYIECDADGYEAAGDGRCNAITGYPTWEINGKLYGGYKTLGALAQLSGFQAKPLAPESGAGFEEVLKIEGLGGVVGKKDKDCTLSGGKEECEKQ